jgi:hypothetical protein
MGRAQLAHRRGFIGIPDATSPDILGVASDKTGKASHGYFCSFRSRCSVTFGKSWWDNWPIEPLRGGGVSVDRVNEIPRGGQNPDWLNAVRVFLCAD